MLRASPFGRLLVLSILGAGLSACTASDHRSSSVSVDDLRARLFTNDERSTLATADRVLTGTCMRARGFDLPQVALPPLEDWELNDSRRWGVSDSSTALASGYHAPTPTQADNVGAEDRYLATLSAAQRAKFYVALTGDQSKGPPSAVAVKIPGTQLTERVSNSFTLSGCRPATEEKLSGDRMLWLALQAAVQKLATDADTRARASKQFIQTLKDWSTCFKARGFTAADPLIAAEFYSTPGPTPGPEEVNAAVADVACKAEVALGSAWSDALSEALAFTDDDLAQSLTAWLETKRVVLKNAAALVAQADISGS